MSDGTMRAMLLREPGARLEAVRVPIPRPGLGEVLVKLGAASVGLTVVNYLDPGMRMAGASKLPRIPGHEVTGTVAEVGPGVTSFKPGDRVCNYAYLSCGRCRQCLRAREPLCRNLRGLTGVRIDGAYAEYCVLPEFNVVPLPDDVSFIDASAIVDAVVTSYHIISARANVRPGDVVTIIGAAGGVGIHLVQMARLFGGDVIAVDADDAKLERTREYGAMSTINFSSGDALAQLHAATQGEGSDVVVDMVGRPETLAWAQEALAPGGRAVFLTAFPGVKGEFEPRYLVMKEIALLGSRAASKFELVAAIELVRSGKIRPVVSEVCSLEEVETLHDRLRAATLFGRGAISFE